MKASRADVAKLANVSTATVSYVLNNSRSVSPETRQRVLDAVAALQYTPDMIARSMKVRDTMQVALMLNDLSNPYYSEIALGFESAAIEKGYFVNVCTGYTNIDKYFDNYIARRIDGLFVVAIPSKFDMERLYWLVDNGIKVVIGSSADVNLKRVSSVGVDYQTGMRDAVAHLLGLGHERIGYLSGLSRTDRYDNRAMGYLKALRDNGLNYADELLFDRKTNTSTGIRDGFDLAKVFLNSRKDCTALICTNDLMAMGAIACIEQAGLTVPGDFSVMGFDDIQFSKMWRPPLTSMSVRKANLGAKAFDLLYTDIQNDQTGYYSSRLELVQRASTMARG